MSTPFYDLASLVLVPSGYKTSKVYAQKPLTTDGQLAFTRSTTATRVASNGLIEKVRTNLAAYSEQFDNAYWTKSNITVTANSTTNPINGATTADTIARSGGISSFVSRQIAQTGIVTFSVFAKAGSTNEVRLNTFDGSTDRGATYNLTTGAITSVYGSPLFTLAQDFGSGWYRISIAVNAATYANCQVHIDSLNSVIIFGAQLETGDIATDYIATTTAAVSVGPVANVPRLDYLNSSCPRLLLEPQRTNLLPMSEQITNATFWNFLGGNLVAAANVAISPDGTQNADSITLSNTANRYYVSSAISITAGTVVTYSVYMKSTSGTLTIGMGLVNGATAILKTVTTEWQRFFVTFTMHAGGAEYFGIEQRGAGASTSGTLLFWGAQVEEAAYATSYIPTLGASVTRGADAASKTGISSLIGQTEGTSFLDFQFNGTQESIIMDIAATGLSPQNRIILYNSGNNTINLVIFTANVQQASILSSAYAVGQRIKVGVGYKVNDFVLYINGVQIGTDNSGTVPATSRVDIGNRQDAGFPAPISVNQTLLFKTRLTNAQLAELTTI